MSEQIPFEYQTFKKVAITTQVLYQTLLQATHSSANGNVVTAEMAEVLHEAAKLLATIANVPAEAGSAWLKLIQLSTAGMAVQYAPAHEEPPQVVGTHQ